jgi:hypothetical protein
MSYVNVDAEAPHLLNIGQCSTVARRHSTDIHFAMVHGQLPYVHLNGRRHASVDDLLKWMREYPAQPRPDKRERIAAARRVTR